MRGCLLFCLGDCLRPHRLVVEAEPRSKGEVSAVAVQSIYVRSAWGIQIAEGSASQVCRFDGHEVYEGADL